MKFEIWNNQKGELIARVNEYGLINVQHDAYCVKPMEESKPVSTSWGSNNDLVSKALALAEHLGENFTEIQYYSEKQLFFLKTADLGTKYFYVADEFDVEEHNDYFIVKLQIK